MTTELGNIEKNVAIALSGCYDYTPQDIAGFVSYGAIPAMPPEMRDRRFFTVYRPAPVLAASVQKFAKLPVTDEHPPELLNPQNYRDYNMGTSGEAPVIDWITEPNEVRILSTMSLNAQELQDAYRRGIREVSPGYIADFVWKIGKAPDGRDYQIVMTNIREVNHLAMTQKGRGGKLAAILDSKGGSMTHTWKSGLRWFLNKLGVKDDAGFREQLTALVAPGVAPETIEAGAEQLKNSIADLPESAEKGQLSRYLDDLPALAGTTTPDQAAQLVNVISTLFESLDTSALQDGGLDMVVPTKDADVPDPKAGNTGGPNSPPSPPAPSMDAPDPVTPEAPDPATPEAGGTGAGVTLETLPDDGNFSAEQIKFILMAAAKMLKGAKPAAAPAPVAPPAAPADAPGDVVAIPKGNPEGDIDGNAGGKDLHIHVNDSVSLFHANVDTDRKINGVDDFIDSIYGSPKKAGK